MTASMNESRERPRLSLKFNVEFLKEGEERQASRLGTTTNISAGGVHFTTTEWEGMNIGDHIEVRLSGLSGYGTGPLFRNLRARAKVLRLDTPEEATGPYGRAAIAVRFSERPCFEVYNWTE